MRFSGGCFLSVLTPSPPIPSLQLIFVQQTELAFERDAVFVFVIQVSKGLKLLARLVRLLSPQQLEDLVVQLMRVMPLVATEATGLKLSEEAENLVKRLLCGAIKNALDRMPFVQPLNIVRRVKANMPNDATMAQAVWGAVRHGVARWQRMRFIRSTHFFTDLVFPLNRWAADLSQSCCSRQMLSCASAIWRLT